MGRNAFHARCRLPALAQVSIIAFAATGFADPPFAANLIVNGDAEAGPSSPDGFALVPVPGWTLTSTFVVCFWDTPGGFPTNSDPGPPNRGLNFFAGGDSTALSTAAQSIDVSAGAAVIDDCRARFDLAAYLGGYSSQGDHAVLTITFRAAGGSSLGSASIGPVTAADRGSLTGLLTRSTSGLVPAGTRTVDVLLRMTRLNGSYDDGYADNLELVLTAQAGGGCSGCRRCDLNDDTRVDGDDVQTFANLLMRGGGTAQQICAGDVEAVPDRHVDADDVPNFVACLLGP